MRYPKCAATLALSASVVGLLVASPAQAQVDITPAWVGMTAQDVGVLDRARPAYDAKGIPMGGFRLYPTLDLLGAYDDNVFRTPTGLSDYFFTIAPALRLQSQWGRHSLMLYATMADYEYVKYASEGLTDWSVGGNSRLDVSHAITLNANLSYGEYHEDWSTPNIVGNQASPNRYYMTHALVEATVQPSRLGVGFGGEFIRYDWTQTPIIGGGFTSNKDRNMDNYQAFGRVFYDFSPGYSIFVKYTYDDRSFDQVRDRSSLYRSSHGYRLDGGLDMQVTHLISGEIFVGYRKQSFDQNVVNPLPDVSGLDYSVQLNWFVSPILTLHINGSRELDDVIISGASVADNKSIALSADYEFRPNIILQGRVYYRNTSYPGTIRKENYPGASVGLVYLINRYMSANLNYNYSDRSTNGTAPEYTDNMLSAGITLHL